MSLFMENSLKLSYDMLFQNGSYETEAEPQETDHPDALTPEEIHELLQERDEQWERKLEEERATAKQAGIEEGFAKGKEEAERALEERLSAIRDMMDKIDHEFNRSLEELKPHMAELVFEITEKVLDIPFEHPTLRGRVQDEITKFVETLDEELHVKVSVSKMDYEAIQQAFEENSSISHFTLRADEACNPGEYTIETKKESIIKNFKKMVADFKESISFADTDALEPET